jgi:murein DD-endopeptidase MepM/ murein hydrolase activator NlpD
MNTLTRMALLLQALIPLLLIGWVAAGWKRPRVLLMLDAAIAACYIFAISIAGLWLALPQWLPKVYTLALVVAAGSALWRARAQQRVHLIAVAPRAILLAVSMGVVAYGYNGQRPLGNAVALEFPLVEGDYLVGNGGTNTLVNAHSATLNSWKYRAYRGQSYGIDIVGVGGWGSRKAGLLPADPERYAIFGARVISPCDGRIIAAVDGRPDMPVPQRDRAHLEGNHVIVACDNMWILLAHLRRGSVRQKQGAWVRTGDLIGEVGNSGNTDEPHLHVHVQRPGTPDAPLSGEPLPVRFGNLWLTRNMHVSMADDDRGGTP